MVARRYNLRMSCDELEFVEWLRAQEQPRRADVALGIGDDMAVLAANAGLVLLTSDMLLDGVHFDTERHAPAAIGRKAMACSLSDCAAMAVGPVAATVSVALPRGWSMGEAQQLYRGMLDMAGGFETVIVGGDTNRWGHPLAIDVTVAAAPYPNVDPVTRYLARPGDRLYVTGKLGGSLLGRHLAFSPRVREAQRLGETLGVRLHAMMDISDGLSLDLWRMCRASKVGALLDEPLLEAVVHDDARTLADLDGHAALEHALSDGEDFELLLAVEGEAAVDGVNLYPVGSVVEEGFSIRRANGRVEALEPRGFVH